MAIVNKFNVNKQEVTLDPDIIENMSANDVSYNSSLQYNENTIGNKLNKLSELENSLRDSEETTKQSVWEEVEAGKMIKVKPTSPTLYGGKNIIKPTNGTYNNNGVSCVVNDGVYTLDGTASGTTYVKIPCDNIDLSFASKKYLAVFLYVDGGSCTDFPTLLLTGGSTAVMIAGTKLQEGGIRALTNNISKPFTHLIFQIPTGISFSNFKIRLMVCLSFDYDIEHIGNYDFGNVPVVKNEEFEDIPVQDVTIQSYSGFDFTTIEFVSKFEKIEREIFEISEGINESKVDMSPYMVKYSPECDIDGEAVKSKFFTRREEVRRPYITEQSKTIYWNPNTFVDTKYHLSVGNDENDGLSEETAVESWSKAFSMLNDGDTLLIKRGSVIRDICPDNIRKYGIKVAAYGDAHNENPIFDNLIPIDSWQKVSGYNHIYRVKKYYERYVANGNVNYLQCFVDGKRLGADITTANALADKVSCRNIKNYTEAMTYLDAHPNESCWCSCYERTSEEPKWEAGEYYWYISLQDTPSNHKIEITSHIVVSLLDFGNWRYVDIRDIRWRGNASKDGVRAGIDVFMENCEFIDNPNYAVESLGGEFWCLNCISHAESGAVNTQFHYYGNSSYISQSQGTYHPSDMQGVDIAFIGCKVLSGRNYGTRAFAGHRSDYIENPVNNMYVIDCYAENCAALVNGSDPKSILIKNLHAKNCEYLGTARKIIIDGLYYDSSNIKRDTFVSKDFGGKLIINNAIIMVSKKDRYGIWYNLNPTEEYNNITADVRITNSKFIFTKTSGSETYLNNFICNIPAKSTLNMDRCVVALNSEDGVKHFFDKNAGNVHLNDCIIFGDVDVNVEKEGCHTDTIDNMLNPKYLARLMYVDNGSVCIAGIPKDTQSVT